MNAAVSTQKNLASWIAYLRSHAAIKRQLNAGTCSRGTTSR